MYCGHGISMNDAQAREYYWSKSLVLTLNLVKWRVLWGSRFLITPNLWLEVLSVDFSCLCRVLPYTDNDFHLKLGFNWLPQTIVLTVNLEFSPQTLALVFNLISQKKFPSQTNPVFLGMRKVWHKGCGLVSMTPICTIGPHVFVTPRAGV